MNNKLTYLIILIIFYAIFAICSYCFKIEAGKLSVMSMLEFVKHMLILLPFAFVLIGLFEVWVRRETVERYLGNKTGFSAYLLAIALAGTTIGGLFVAFPFAYSLYKKGAKLGVIFTYLSCSGICRIPMTIFEASFLGWKFTIVRFSVSLPLVVISSWLMEKVLQKSNYVLSEPENSLKG